MNIEQKIGFDRIREMVEAECSNTYARRMANEMRFEKSYERVARDLRQVEEFRQIELMENSFPSQDYIDMTPTLERLRVGNTSMEQPELFDLKCSLRTLGEIVRFLQRDEVKEKYAELSELSTHIELNPAIGRAINKIIDDKGELFDNASDLLQDIRRQINKKRNEVDVQISRSLSRAKREGWAPENAEVTIRNGRMVIPMLDTHRRKIKGLIHDESATRQTAYLEPTEVVELNNDLRELEFAERHEIQKILMRFCDMIRPQLDELVNAYWVLARIDFIRAKARFAIRMNAGLPKVEQATKIDWLEARHPLLYLQRKENGGDVVPFQMTLNEQKRILIISGPNAGGKSVCLKAVGLIQYMLQCGLLVPCRETSEFGLFDSIFIDIGDQQSIDNDLSTYTSHLQNLKNLLETANEKTLFLLDELGGGTEPRSGCAIAEALLEEMHERGAYGVVTTHFADLKLLADQLEGVENGAMMFDTEKMRPLYRLTIGHPGSSFAFEIANNVGFPEKILAAASQKVGTEMLNFEHQLQQIELDKQEIARKQTELDVSDKFLAEIIEKYQTLNEKLESKKYDIISQARHEAKQIIADANRTVEQTISEIKAAQAEKERTQQAREKMKAEAERIESEQKRHEKRIEEQLGKEKIAQKKAAPKPTDEELDMSPLEVGDIVKIDGQESYAQVVELKGKKAVVESNSVRMTIEKERITKTKKKAIPVDKTSRKNARFQSIYDEINEKRKYFNPTLDLRGKRGDEAMEELRKFMDEAQLLGEKELRILHGKGWGILKTLVREQLQSNKEVRSYRSEHIELGGDGVTIVEMK